MGLIRCGSCGHAVKAELKKKRFVYYHCTGYGGQQKPEYYRQERLDSQFLGVIQAITIPEALRDWLHGSAWNLSLSTASWRPAADGKVWNSREIKSRTV